MKKELTFEFSKEPGSIQFESKLSFERKVEPLRRSFPKSASVINEANMEAFIYKVGMKGTDLDKAKLSKILSIQDTFGYKSISDIAEKLNQEERISNYIAEGVKNLSEAYGQPFNSDAHIMAFDIYTDYGGLTMLDFIIFFQKARKGEFKKENQFVSSKGVTREYLIDWINAYCDDKEKVRQGMHRLAMSRVENGSEIKLMVIDDKGKHTKLIGNTSNEEDEAKQRSVMKLYQENQKKQERLKNKSKEISTLIGYIYYYFCLPYFQDHIIAKKEANKSKGLILESIKEQYKQSSTSLNEQEYTEVMERRYINRIKTIVKVNMLDYLHALILSAYTVEDLQKKYNVKIDSISKYNLSQAIMVSKKDRNGNEIKSLYDTYKEEWIDYASNTEKPMVKKQWIFIQMKVYFMKGIDSKHDPLNGIYMQSMFNFQI